MVKSVLDRFRGAHQTASPGTAERDFAGSFLAQNTVDQALLRVPGLTQAGSLLALDQSLVDLRFGSCSAAS